MPFDLANRSLVQKMALLVTGTTLFVTLAIAAISDLMLRQLAADLIQARLSEYKPVYELRPGMAHTSLKNQAPLLSAGDSVSLTLSQAVESVAEPSGAIQISEDGAELGALRRASLLLSLVVFGTVASIGTFATCSLLEPLKELETDADRLAKGDTSVQFRGMRRSDEIGNIAQSFAAVQQSVIELLKAQRATAGPPASGAVAAAAAREMWAAICNELRNIKDMLLAEYHVVAGRLQSQEGDRPARRAGSSAWDTWKAWLTSDTHFYRSATGK